ncbi:MAG: hypothetical protein GC136_06935 [Alphaproteobacteria bacterium]|nr:hypothetical protein [Alphaproteobacteria bacterium]
MTKGKRYFFDLHDFSKPTEPVEEIPAEPPPPVFSLEELNQVKEAAIEQGRQQGLAEAEASREKEIADVLAQFAVTLNQLHSHETARNKVFEREAVETAQAVLRAAHPVLDQYMAKEDVTDFLMKLLPNHMHHSKIIIDVHAGFLPDIENKLFTLIPQARDIVIFEPLSEDAPQGTCKMRWNNGGAVRSSQEMVDELLTELQKLLDIKRQTKDNTE